MALVVVRPLRRRGAEPSARRGRAREELEAAKEAKYREIRDAELDHRMGKLSEEDWRALDRELRARGDRDPARARPARGPQPDGGTAASLRAVEAILSGVQVILAVVLIVLILLHSGKDAGLSGAFGVGTGARPVRRRLARGAQPQPLDGRFALLFVANVIVLLKI